MSYLALYRKYRPKSFDDFVGQSEVSSIIKNEVLNNKISHAYLFSGSRGTGKTSTAKIIARMINCSNLNDEGIPCGECDSCLNFNSNSDIVEIDAASNNGVDEIRELRDKVNLVPTFGKYKIYIIDEVHMLTTQAFNALLKTLEEPPAHVIFILATTEFHKIPITVVSRCQRFQFLKFSIDDIVNKLKKIADNESIDVDDEVLYEIARLSDGGLRDAINMLDQLSSFKDEKLIIDDVYKLNGVLSYVEFKNLLHFIYLNDVIAIVDFLENVDKTGKSFERFIDDLISFLKDILIYKNTKILNSNIQDKDECIVFLSDEYLLDDIYNFIFMLNDVLVRIKNSSFAKILLITEFIKFSNKISKTEDFKYKNNVRAEQNKQTDNSVDTNLQTVTKSENNYLFTNVGITDKTKKIRINNTFVTASKEYKEFFLKKWSLIIDRLSNNNAYVSIAGMMSDVEVLVVGEKNVIFMAQYDSLLDRLNSQLQLIEKLLFEEFGILYKAVFLLKDEWEYEKSKYISNLKAKYEYVYIEEECDLVNSSEKDEDVDKIVSILGADVIKYN